MPAWVWFLVALLAAGGGALLLFSDRSGSAAPTRGRKRWAEQKSWEFVPSDPVLPARWRYGAVRDGGPGRAVDLATGAVPGPGGRRLAHVFDHEQGDELTGVVAAVRGQAPLPVAIELRLPSGPRPDGDAGLDSMGRVGDRHAYVTSVLDARPFATDEVATAADAVGDDVPLIWAEDTWVLAAAPPGTGPERMEEVLRALVAVSVGLESAMGVETAGPAVASSPADTHDTTVLDPDDDGRRTDTLRSSDPDDHRTDDHRTDEFRTDGHRTDEHHTDELHDLDLTDPDDDGGWWEGPEGGGSPTHRDRPADVPYDVESDGGSDADDDAGSTRPTGGRSGGGRWGGGLSGGSGARSGRS